MVMNWVDRKAVLRVEKTAAVMVARMAELLVYVKAVHLVDQLAWMKVEWTAEHLVVKKVVL